MSEHPHPIDRSAAPPPHDVGVAPAIPNQPASFWVASLASLAVIVGGVGPWATVWNLVSISGTSMHGWREVGVGAVGLAMLGLYQLRGLRPTLIIAAVSGVLGAVLAITTLSKITSGGAITVLGVQYRYMDAAWGLYLVLVGTVTLASCAAFLTWRAYRPKR